MTDAIGNLFVIAAPSGAGKTSLVRALVERDARLQLSVSHTTRAPRPAVVACRQPPRARRERRRP